MAGFRKPLIAREQQVLWSQRLDDALPPDHPARLFDELFNSGALAPLFTEWSAEYHLLEGHPPYHPRDLVMLYCYGMLYRLRSSRQLEAACHNRLDFIWLMSGHKPDHTTIATFVTANNRRVSELFRLVVRLGIKAGVVRMEHAAIDGSCVEASAGRGSVYKEDTLIRREAGLEKQIADLEKEFKDNERREGLLIGVEPPGPDDGRRLERLHEKRSRLHEALESIARRRREAQPHSPDPKPIASITDPDSRVMKDKEGRRKPNYNTQIVVDGGADAAGMIVAADVNDRANDLGQLMEMIAQTQEQCGSLPEEFSADAGYNTGRDLAELEAQRITAFVDDKKDPISSKEAREAVAAVRSGGTLSLPQIAALPRDANTFFHRCAFAYRPDTDTYRCPAGETLTLFRWGRRYDKDGGLERKRYKTPACAACPLGGQCCRDPVKGREVNRTEFEDAKERMKARMVSDVGKARYQLRAQTVEPRIGTLKSVLGMRKFLRRGLVNVRAEWQLACTALNIGILLRHWTRVRPALT